MKCDKLHIGCGHEHKKNFINIDKAKEVSPDKVVDIENGLPFKDNTFNYIYSAHCLEHIRPHKWNFVLNEIARIAKHNCILELKLPFDSIRCRGNIDHYRTFNFGSWEQLYAGRGRNYYSKLRLEPIIKYNYFTKLFFYLFPLLKAEVHFKFYVIKGEGGYICVECGKRIEKIKGSMKHPYCKECFSKVWNNDYDKYLDWLRSSHF